MDCLTARHLLDIARPAEVAGPEEVQAAAHVSGCRGCQSVVRARRELDRQVGVLIGQLPVPTGLKERLLAQVQSVPQPEGPSPAESPTVRVPRLRRRWLLTASVAVLLLAVGGPLLLSIVAPRPSISYVALLDFATAVEAGGSDLPVLTEFASGVRPSPPRAVKIAGVDRVAPRQASLGGQTFGVWTFSVLDSRRHRLPARLLVVTPAGMVAIPATVGATHGRWAVGHWIEGDLLYVLAVDGPERELRRILPTTTL